MAERLLVKGNEAIAMAAIAAGCRFYFGYPITPQNDIPEYLSEHLPKAGGTFLQAESEIASINMVMGAAASGVRAMTSSSGPGLSLKQEGISYMAGSELPCVVVNMSRSSPGLGGISPSQGDYFQSTRGGGQGDYRTPVLAPASVQEAWDLTFRAFDLADKYRNPVLILGDGLIGQMKEPLDPTPPPPLPDIPEKDYVLTGAAGRPQRILKTLYLADGELETHVRQLGEKYERIRRNEALAEERGVEDAEVVLIAYGSASRIVKGAVQRARAKGLPVGMIRPITLWPFPEEAVRRAAGTAKALLTVELNLGQMHEDVRLAVEGSCPTRFYGRPNGAGSLPSPEEILQAAEALLADPRGELPQPPPVRKAI